MPYVVYVSYPADAEFNLDYYLKTHMPLVEKTWSPVGLKSWRVISYKQGTHKYGVEATLVWGTEDEFKASGQTTEGKAVLADIDNYSDKKPDFSFGEELAHS